MSRPAAQAGFLSHLRVLDPCSFSGEDVRSGQVVEYQAGKVFPIASCAKLVVLASAAKLMYRGMLERDVRVRIRRHERLAGSGILKRGHASWLTVEELCLALVCYSDNTAYNKLFEVVGKAHVDAFLDETGMSRTQIHPLREATLSSNVSCASDLRLFWKTAGSSSNRDFRFLFRMLRENKSRMFVGALLPAALVFHKTGVLDHSADLCVNDTGLIRASNRSYSVTFLTRRQRSLEESGLKIAILTKLFVESMAAGALDHPS